MEIELGSLVQAATRLAGLRSACLAMLMAGAPVALAWQPPAPAAKEDLRSYGEGPLAAGDYLARPPSPLPQSENGRMFAFTWTHIRFEFRYRYQQQAGGYAAALSDLRATAYVDRAASWNAVPRDARLLDHEQGHFDIAQQAALELEADAIRLIGRGKPLEARGPTQSAAVAELRRQLDALTARHESAAAERHAEYDRMTVHGTVGSAQAQCRREQKENLEKAARALQETRGNGLLD